MSHTYTIAHITDLLNIPSDRLNAALDELKVMIPMMRMSMGLIPEDKTPAELCPSIQWVDDGGETHSVRFKDGSPVSVTVEKPGDPKVTDLIQAAEVATEAWVTSPCVSKDDVMQSAMVNLRSAINSCKPTKPAEQDVDAIEPNDHEWFVHAPDGTNIGYVNADGNEVNALVKARLKYNRADVCVTWRKYVG